jgi:thiol:disulfide interchange protein
MDSKVNFLYAILAVVLIASVALLTYSCSSPATPKYFPKKVSLEDVMSAADQADKPVFALFSADWSEPCQKLKRGALSSSRIADWIVKNAQPILIDMTDADAGDADAAALFKRYAIEDYPTIMLLRKGHEVARLEGVVSAGELLKWLTERAVPPPTAPTTPGG